MITFNENYHVFQASYNPKTHRKLYKLQNKVKTQYLTWNLGIERRILRVAPQIMPRYTISLRTRISCARTSSHDLNTRSFARFEIEHGYCIPNIILLGLWKLLKLLAKINACRFSYFQGLLNVIIELRMR